MTTTPWMLVIVSLFAALSAGLLTAVGIAEWRGRIGRLRGPGLALALVTLLIALAASVLQVGHPERIFGSFRNLRSGMTRELIVFLVVGLFLAVRLAGPRRPAVRDARASALPFAGAVLLVLALADCERSPTAPLRDVAVLVLVYVASAAVLGALAFGVLAGAAKADVETVRATARIALAAIAAEAVTVAISLVDLPFAGIPGRVQAAMRLMEGDLALTFWLGVVMAGLVIPAALAGRQAKSAQQRRPAAMALALVFSLAGGIALRDIIYATATHAFSF